MKSFIETYGRVAISIIVVAVFISFLGYMYVSSQKIEKQYTGDLSAEGKNIDEGLVSGNKIPSADLLYDDPSKTSPKFNSYFQIEDGGDTTPDYTTRDELLEGIEIRDGNGHIVPKDDITIVVYRHKVLKDENGRIQYENVKEWDKYKGYVKKDVSGNDITTTQIATEWEYVGFIRSIHDTDSEESLSQNGIAAITGISNNSPGKYKIVYRYQDPSSKLKTELTRVILIEY